MAMFMKLGPVQAADVDSEAATDGQVLTADGAGAAAWEDAAGGASEVTELGSAYQIAGAILVATAGTGEVNGVYIPDGTDNGRTKYVPDGFPTGGMDLLIRWSGTQWLLEDVGEDLLYYSSDDVATPDLVTTWEADNGDEPVPVVSDATNAPDGYLLAADGSGDCVFDPPSWFSSPDGGRYVPMGIATGQYAISEGILADASGNYSHAEGYITEASGNYSHAEGNETEASGEASHAEGSKSTASGNYSHAEGLESQARLPGSYASSSVNYEQQHARYLLNATTSDDTPQEMLCGTERLAVPIDTVYVFRALVSGSKANAVQVAGYEFAGVIKNASGTTSIVGAVTKTVLAEEDAAWDCDITADNANDALTITVTGVAATSIRWQATVWTSEIQYP